MKKNTTNKVLNKEMKKVVKEAKKVFCKDCEFGNIKTTDRYGKEEWEPRKFKKGEGCCYTHTTNKFTGVEKVIRTIDSNKNGGCKTFRPIPVKPMTVEEAIKEPAVKWWKFW